MNNMKTTKTNDLAESDIEENSLVSTDTKTKKTHDRPAVFIEELMDQDQYNRSNKSN